jgi:molybdopterin molybdotransferase
MIPFEKALKIVIGQAKPLKTEKVDILSSSGRVLAGDIRSNCNIPPFDRSAMDGFAVRADDTRGTSKNNPVKLEVIGNLAAGYSTDRIVGRGKAVRIMTGAPVPEGADAVIMVEYTATEEHSRNGHINILREVKTGENIGRAGEDIKRGELILKKGKLIRPAEIGMLASLGKYEINVFKKPRVSIISTGDEIVDTDRKLKAGEIRDSNSFSVYSQVLCCGGEPVRIGIARDRKADILKKIRKAIILDSNIIILSGGVSVGDYDIVKNVLINLKVKPLFWKVAIKPGKPIFFGTLGKRLIFGLPGNTVSSMVTFELLVKPAIMAMLSRKNYTPLKVLAILDKEINKKKGRKNFIRGIISLKEGVLHVVPTGTQKSGVLKSMVLANALIEVDEHIENIKSGTQVLVRLLNENS